MRFYNRSLTYDTLKYRLLNYLLKGENESDLYFSGQLVPRSRHTPSPVLKTVIAGVCMLRIWWPNIISNKDLWNVTGQEDINVELKKKKENLNGSVTH